MEAVWLEALTLVNSAGGCCFEEAAGFEIGFAGKPYCLRSCLASFFNLSASFFVKVCTEGFGTVFSLWVELAADLLIFEVLLGKTLTVT